MAVQFANVEGVVQPDGGAVLPDDAAARRPDRGPEPGPRGARRRATRGSAGWRGRVVEVRNATNKHASILDVPPGRLGIDADRALWIAFLDTPDDGVLAIMVGGPSEGWDEALAIAEPVLESVVIGG